MSMRITAHNGRVGKKGVYSVKHNDRNFDTQKDEHIDVERSQDNWYWHYYQKVAPGLTFEEAETRFYEEHFSDELTFRNERAMQSRHPERVRTMDEYRTSRQTCPEETILQIGNAGNTINSNALWNVVIDYVNWELDTFPNVQLLDIALHVDEEGAPHIHERKVWVAHENGREIVGQSKALKEMGIKPPDESKKYGQHNNAKMTYTAMCRDKLMEMCREIGYDIETKPKEASEVGLSLVEYKTQQEQIRKDELTEECVELADERESLDKECDELEDERDNIEAERDRLKAETTDLSNRKHKLKENIDTLEAKKTHLEANIGCLERIRDFCVERIQAIQKLGNKVVSAFDVFRQSVESARYNIKIDGDIGFKRISCHDKQHNEHTYYAPTVKATGELMKWGDNSPLYRRGTDWTEKTPRFSPAYVMDNYGIIRQGFASHLWQNDDDYWHKSFNPATRTLCEKERETSNKVVLSDELQKEVDACRSVIADIDRLEKRQRFDSTRLTSLEQESEIELIP